jgi:hypothetical protein
MGIEMGIEMKGPTPSTSKRTTANAMGRQRLDWADFFRRVPRPHGIRIRLAGFDAAAPEGLRAEKRLIRIVKARAGSEPFALRRSFTSGPPIIDCMFTVAAAADQLAKEIGAAPVRPPPGWASARELVADRDAIRRIMKMGTEDCLPRVPSKPAARVDVAIEVVKPAAHRAAFPASAEPSLPPEPRSNAVDGALKRLARMSPHEQAAALFRSMMGEESANERE